MASKSDSTSRKPAKLEGLGHCYVMTPLKPAFEGRVISEAIEPALKSVGLDRLGPRLPAMEGQGVFDQIAKHIAQARICIADLTANNANVAAEVGIAIALSKPLILITRDMYKKVAFDFSHLCVIHYTLTNLTALKDNLTGVLEEHAGAAATDRLLLRQMLAPSSLGELEVGKAVVAASPLSYREARRSKGGYKGLRRTSADNVGIRGLLNGFGALFALNYLPELVNPGDYSDDVLTNGPGFNLYTIGSPKANRWTGLALNQMNQQWTPSLTFAPDPESEDLRDVRVIIHRDRRPLMVLGESDSKSRTRREWDFGLVLRAPNPFASDRMLMVVAGRSALGTQAACMAATEAAYLRRLNAKVAEYGIDLDDHKQAFVAVVHMSASRNDDLFEADPSTLRIASVEPLIRSAS
jgi:nucleoside 2-deoxyribosyltransferase